MNAYTENKSWIKDHLCIWLDTSKVQSERQATKAYIQKEFQIHDFHKMNCAGLHRAGKGSTQNHQDHLYCQLHTIATLWILTIISTLILSVVKPGSMRIKNTGVHFQFFERIFWWSDLYEGAVT